MTPDELFVYHYLIARLKPEKVTLVPKNVEEAIRLLLAAGWDGQFHPSKPLDKSLIEPMIRHN